MNLLETIVICEATEYQEKPTMQLNEMNSFHIYPDCMVIKFSDSEGLPLHSSEIEIEAAIKLANVILTLNK